MTGYHHVLTSKLAALTLVLLVAGACESGGGSSAQSTTTSTRAPTADLTPAVPLSCDQAIGAGAPSGDGRTVVLGRVALPTKRALQANSSGEADPNARLFAKNGLLIKPGAQFELIVPEAWRGHLTIGWGNPGTRAEHLKVSCPSTGSSARWPAYAGGYWVGEPACVPLIVKAGSQTRRVHIGVGASCPGQAPPPPGS